jgi:hypothetical protein
VVSRLLMARRRCTFCGLQRGEDPGRVGTPSRSWRSAYTDPDALGRRVGICVEADTVLATPLLSALIAAGVLPL